MHPPATTFHLTWVDAAKGIGITLVVVGHVMRGLANSEIMPWTPTTRFVDTWIYAFHMPLFFLLSGLFLFRSMRKSWPEFAREKVGTIAYPYLVWSVITLAIKSVLGSSLNHPYDLTDFPRILYQPIDQFWFLYVLFVLLLVAFALLKFGVRPWVLLLITIAVYPGLHPYASYGWGILAQCGMMGIYVALGVVLGNDRNVHAISFVRNSWLAVAAIVGIMFASLAGWFDVMERAILDPIFAVSGIVGAVAFAVLTDKGRFGHAIRMLGRYSLEIYLVHTIASAGVRIVLIKFGRVSDPTLHLFVGTVAGLYVPIAVAVVLRKCGFNYAFTLKKRDNATAPIPPPHAPERV